MTVTGNVDQSDLTRVLEIMDWVTNHANGQLDGHEKLNNLEGVDSLARLEIMVALDDAFSIKVQPDDIDNCDSIADLVTLVTELKK